MQQFVVFTGLFVSLISFQMLLSETRRFEVVCLFQVPLLLVS